MKQMLDTRCNNKWNKCNNKWNKWIGTNGHMYNCYPMQFSYTIYEQMAHVQLLSYAIFPVQFMNKWPHMYNCYPM